MSPALGGEQPDLILYTYDSFMAQGGLGREIVPLFEKQCGCRVQALPSGDSAQLVTRLQLDSQRGKPVAHVVVGLDQWLVPRARPWLAKWGTWKPKSWNKVGKTFRELLGNDVLPWDYGVFSLIVDQKKGIAHKSIPLKGLLDPQWKRSLILEDPRTSGPGLAFLLYTRVVFGDQKEQWRAFWRHLKSQWLTLAPGWDAAYSLFLRGEAPLVWSYSTSQAYHEEKGQLDRYRVLYFEEGQPFQVEAAALVDGPHLQGRTLERAREFLEFLISAEVQSKIPRGNWMMPVIEGGTLPRSFERIPAPKRQVAVSLSPEQVSEVLKEWSLEVSR